MSLTCNTLDMVRKEYAQLTLFLIDEASLIGSRISYNIDKWIHEIMHTWTTPFGNIDIIFCGDLCQAQALHDHWVFEHPNLTATSAPYSFWRDNVKDFELKQVMQQENKEFVSVLNKLRIWSHTDNYLVYLIENYYRCLLNDPKFTSLFYLNKDVKKHNEKMLSLIDTWATTLIANAKVVKSLNIDHYNNAKIQLPIVIVLKQIFSLNLLVEIMMLKTDWSMALKALLEHPKKLKMVSFGLSLSIQWLAMSNKKKCDTCLNTK